MWQEQIRQISMWNSCFENCECKLFCTKIVSGLTKVIFWKHNFLVDTYPISSCHISKILGKILFSKHNFMERLFYKIFFPIFLIIVIFFFNLNTFTDAFYQLSTMCFFNFLYLKKFPIKLNFVQISIHVCPLYEFKREE